MIRFSNSKLKRDGIGYWSLPAGKTCPQAGECKKGCYAMQGFFVMPNVKNSLERNFEATKKRDFVGSILADIEKKAPKIIRIHTSGDFYNLAYLNKWIEIAVKAPSVKFYAYTKMVAMVKAATLPPNLVIIFSEGGKQDSLIKPSDRHSRVFSSLAALKKAKYKDTTTNDINAIGKNPKIGLVYHGHKSRAWESRA